MAVSEAGMALLQRLDDYAVGGREVTPAAESFNNLKTRRVGLGTVTSWTNYEAVHINPAYKSLNSAYDFLRLDGPLPGNFMDRVLVMDFDIYDKSGNLKALQEVTPDEILDRLLEGGFPLPYCYIQSGTAGNFHMMWVYKYPKPRVFVKGFLRKVYRSWGADPRFTNSTMRNPLYLEAHDPSSVHWWDEWATREPLLEEVSDLITEDDSKKPSGSTRTRVATPSEGGLFQPRLSQTQLEFRMRQARDGDGRWHLLRSWLLRRIMSAYDGVGIPPNDMMSLAEWGNQLFSQPMEDRRVRELAGYWTPARQEWYVARQVKAGESNPKAILEHKQAVLKYFEVYDLREELLHYLKIGLDNLPQDLRERDRQYQGRKLAPTKTPCYAYLAWMLRWEDRDEIDMDTGEVLNTTTAAAQVRSILSNGNRQEYSREEYLSFLEDFDLTNEEEVGMMKPPMLGTSNNQLASTKGLTYAC